MRSVVATSPLTPETALARWPRDWPLVVLWSGAGDAAGSRVLLGRPRGAERLPIGSPGDLRRALTELEPRSTEAHQRHEQRPVVSAAPGTVPPVGSFHFPLTVFAIDYEAGRIIEPAAARNDPHRSASVVRLAVDDALVFDRRTGRAWEVGDLRASELSPPASCHTPQAPAAGPMRLGSLASRTGRAGYEAAVQRALEYIRAGDVYQVNLAHHLRADFKGSPRALLHALLDQASPRYGAYLETPARTIISASPESFIEFDAATRRVVTRPMKGTRPASGASDLASSQKDRAELAMIVDLMRNDLGRVCEPGSIRVDAARRIETHAGGAVLQAVSEISGTLRAGRTLADVILATFPGGSVTGAPKIRAMQIIEELEAEPRGIYCGTIGYVDAAGNAGFNIAIRTATIENDVVTYPVGAGIVADSVPSQEWEETMLKAGILRNLVAPRDL